MKALRQAHHKERRCPLCTLYYTTPVELGCVKCRRLFSAARSYKPKRKSGRPRKVRLNTQESPN